MSKNTPLSNYHLLLEIVKKKKISQQVKVHLV